MRVMTPAGLAAAGLLLTAVHSTAFPCAVQTSTDSNSFQTQDCSTFCLIAFGRSTLYPPFQVGDNVCQAAGCAVLDGEGNFSLSQSFVGNGDWPMDGEITLYRCDTSTFTTNPVSLSAQSGQACNLYTDLSDARRCTSLNAFKVGSFTRDAPFLEANRWQLIIAGAVLGCLAVVVAVVVAWRRRQATTARVMLQDGVLVDKRPANAKNPEGSAVGAPASSDFPDDNPDAASVRSESLLDGGSDMEAAVGEIPDVYAPGTVVYERFHEALSEIYRTHGQDVSRVDAVLAQYLSRPGGVDMLNDKLRVKFGKKIRVPQKPRRTMLNYEK